jgi:hypothetical protein
LSLVAAVVVKVAQLVAAAVAAVLAALGNCLLSQCLLAPATPLLLAVVVLVALDRTQAEARAAIQAHLAIHPPAAVMGRIVLTLLLDQPTEDLAARVAALVPITVLLSDPATKGLTVHQKAITERQKDQATWAAVEVVQVPPQPTKMARMDRPPPIAAHQSLMPGVAVLVTAALVLELEALAAAALGDLVLMEPRGQPIQAAAAAVELKIIPEELKAAREGLVLSSFAILIPTVQPHLQLVLQR